MLGKGYYWLWGKGGLVGKGTLCVLLRDLSVDWIGLDWTGFWVFFSFCLVRDGDVYVYIYMY